MLKLFFVLLVISLFVLICIFVDHDLQPTVQIHLLSFANRNYYPALVRLEKQAKEFNFDSITFITDEILQKDETFWLKHGNFIKKNERGFGYWIWKSYITLKKLQSLKENDILVYVDAGCELNSRGLSRFKEYLDMVKDPPGILRFELAQNEYCFTKRSLIDFLQISQEHYESKQLVGGIFILRKSKDVVELIKKWYQISQIYDLLNDTPSANNHPEFVEHRHDQSIFSILSKQHGCTIIPDETFFFDIAQGKKFPILAMRNSQEITRLSF